jgi:cytochrome b561
MRLRRVSQKPKKVWMSSESNSRYGAVAQALHWLTAILVLIAFIYGLGGSEQRVYAPSRDAERQLHETLGLAVFVLAVLRLLWRQIDARPAPEPAARWMSAAARAVQALLYVLLFVVPLTAIAGAWLEGHPLTLLGGIEIRPQLATSHATGALLARIHPWLGDAIIWVAGLHAAAAIFHQLILKDGVLASMLPRWLLPSRRIGD